MQDSFCVGTKAIHRIVLLFTHKNGDFGANFCDGENLRQSDLLSEELHIG